MSSRLDRLLGLLSSGSNASIRSTAAQQLGAIASTQVATDPYGAGLISKIVPYLHENSTDTRTAAADAISAIVQAVPLWTCVSSSTTDPTPASTEHTTDDVFSFDMYALLQDKSKILLASADHDLVSADQEGQGDVLKDLGLGGGGPADMDLGIDISKELADGAAQASTSGVSPPVTGAMPEQELSARERAALKRKRKQAPAVQTMPTIKRVKTEPDQEGSSQVVIQHKGSATKIDTGLEEDTSNALLVDPHLWPYLHIVASLQTQLTSPSWQHRHGSALGIQTIIRHQGLHAGTELGLSSLVNQQKHAMWMSDLAMSLLHVLCLDRFGDYVGDTVIAPVREAAGACLATLLDLMVASSYPPDSETVARVKNVLCDMVRQDKLAHHVWQVRHAGLSGLKHLVTVNAAAVENAMDQLLDIALIGINDRDDDVRLVAAECLMPCAPYLAQLPLTTLYEALTRCLADLKDDLASSVGAVMLLLSTLVSQPHLLQQFSHFQDLHTFIPLAFPYFRHTISSVRLAVLRMLSLLVTDASFVDARLLCLLFQNLIVEEKAEIHNATRQLAEQVLSLVKASGTVSVAEPALSAWFGILMTPIGTSFDPAFFFRPDGIYGSGVSASSSGRHDVDKHVMKQDLSLVSEAQMLHGRLAACDMLGTVIAAWPTENQTYFEAILVTYLQSTCALQRYLATVLVCHWHQPSVNTPNVGMKAKLGEQLCAAIEAAPLVTYDETRPNQTVLQTECENLIGVFSKLGKLPAKLLPTVPAPFTLEFASQFASNYAQLVSQLPKAAETKVLPRLAEHKAKFDNLLAISLSRKQKYDVWVNSGVAIALVTLGIFPAKVTPLIQGLMNSLKHERIAVLQERAASALAHFLYVCGTGHPMIKKNPADKVFKNLCLFLCSETPAFSPTDSRAIVAMSPASQSIDKSTTVRAGAEGVFAHLVTFYPDGSLLDKVPKLWSYMSDALLAVPAHDATLLDTQIAAKASTGQDISDATVVLATVLSHLSPRVASDRLEPIWPRLFTVLQSSYCLLRNASARCVAAICKLIPVKGLQAVVDSVLPGLNNPHHVHSRRGGIELIYLLVESLDLHLLPYLIFFIAPVLGRMTDADEPTRLLATNTFASLVRLVPLEAGLPTPEGFSQEALAKRDTERKFLAQLLDGSKAEPYEIPIKVHAALRSYQKAGVSWLAFLARYQLHGILCDDMGLGKTLQTIVILASITHERRKKFQETASPDAIHLPSLVICPPTLTGHWVHEISTYVDNLKAVHYGGDKAERARILTRLPTVDVLVMSYDVARNEIENLADKQWLYIVLDEGHIIKNAKTKLSQALKRLQGQHRLILSGTPVQNHVMELWSLFDFLMPGFMGSERQFHEKFGKPIAASRNAKASSKEQEAATLALASLHKQVLPFLLRRMKEDVLDDLPPKIIQDIECDMSPLQRAMYDLAVTSTDEQPKEHVFQSLQYLRKLVNHPLLVIKPEHDQLVSQFTQGDVSKLHDLSQAPKLQSLRQILVDCGIGGPKVEDDPAASSDTIAPPHRVLIFAQLKPMLDLIENDLFQAHMPHLTYMRLDGSTPSNKRHGLVQRFNADPSIDVLLLTTHVGGLGLTLTGADTVIFVEHDWNPSRDLQAMDRAHRLGQKRVVNVYRLIVKDTIEEKIMGLQRFKMNIASSVVNEDNSGLGSMETDQVLDLFSAPSDVDSTGGGKKSQKKLTRKELLDGLGELDEML